MYQIWLDWSGGYLQHAPFDSVSEAESYITAHLYSLRQYHRVRINDMSGNEIKVIEPVA